jgi:hypothetical protein
MRDPIRRAALVCASVVVLALAGCDTSTPSVPTAPPTGSLGTPVAGSPTGDPSATPSSQLTPVPGGPTPLPSVGPATPVPTTETEWGAIMDALPFDFPVYPGSHEAQPMDGPASGAFSVPASGETTAAWYQAALENAGFSTVEMSSPLEDGQIVIESVGDPLECRVQTTIRPLSGTTHVSVLYGAACPG